MLSSIFTSLFVAGITYLLLYKCCAIICEDKHFSYEELIEEYQISGLLRIVLDTFKIVFDFINNILLKYQNRNIVKKTIYKLLFQIDYPEKPILKFDKYKDKKYMLSYLIKLLESDNKTDSFKHSIETIWQNRWSFFGYSSYIGEILNEIGNMCNENKLPIITFLITYNDGILSNSCFQDKWSDGENGWKKFSIEKGMKSDNEKFQLYIKKMIDRLDDYKNIINKI